MAQMQLLENALSIGDVVFTPDWVASDMVEWFKPTGKILEPCRGDDAIYKYLPADSDWCEINMGRDFFQWSIKADWIITNPPFEKKRFVDWYEHALFIAPDVVYLLPVHLFFRAGSRIENARVKGWLKHVRFYGNGGELGFPMGNPIAAMHFVRGYHGDTSWSWYAPNKA